MEIIAMLTMLVDHVGLVFFQDMNIFHWIGRLAFPIYAYLIVLGYRRTHNIKKYLFRLLFLGCISQIPFIILMDYFMLNVIFTFFICVMVLVALDRAIDWMYKAVIVIIASILLLALPFDYGIYALLLMFIYRYVTSSFLLLVSLHLILNICADYLLGWEQQHWSLISTGLIGLFYITGTYKPTSYFVPRWLWRSFYPLHLSIIAILYLYL